MPCKCYHAERNFLGKIGVCWGTKECEACSCGGDESRCDFYEDKRKKVTPKTTNADRIRAMTDEKLAKFISGKARTFGEEYEGYMSALDWLKQEADT